MSMVPVQWCSEERSKPLTALFQFIDLKTSIRYYDAKCLTFRPALALPAAGSSLSQGTLRPSHLKSRPGCQAEAAHGHPPCQQHSKSTARHKEDSFFPGKGETQNTACSSSLEGRETEVFSDLKKRVFPSQPG